jgi:thymidylate synthase (FAD)
VDIDMKVNLVGITQPMLNGPMCEANAEEFIAYCARVSSSNQTNPDTTKLLSYMVRNRHWSPFEMVNVVMEIETTRDIARQILRHRSFSFQEFSQRYAAVSNMSEPREARLQDSKNRQNSIETDDSAIQEWWKEEQEWLLHEVEVLYEQALANDIAKEVARAILPEGLTMSRMYMNGTLRSWLHYVELRTGNGTQKEHREIAEACKQILRKEFPFLDALWNEDGYIPFA